MDKHTILIVSIVSVVILIGVFTIVDVSVPDLRLSGDSLAGNVVYNQGSTCTHCIGKTVCAVKDGKMSDYKSSCDAICNNAKIIYDNYCSAIPSAKTY